MQPRSVAVVRGQHPLCLRDKGGQAPHTVSCRGVLDQRDGPGEDEEGKGPGRGPGTFQLLPPAQCPWRPQATGAGSDLWGCRAGVGARGLWVRRDGGRMSSTFSFPFSFLNTEQSLFPLFYGNGFWGKPGKINPCNNEVLFRVP